MIRATVGLAAAAMLAGCPAIPNIFGGGVRVETVVGSEYGHVDGPRDVAKLTFPWALSFDGSGNLYVSSQKGDHAIRRISPEGTTTTLAGDLDGFADGPGPDSRFRYPRGLAIAADGTVYVADTGNHRIRKILPDGTVSTFAGSEQGFRNGPADRAAFSSPSDVLLDSMGNMIVSDTENNRLCRIGADGAVTTLAGGTAGDSDGPAREAKFNAPRGLALDGAGNLYVADGGNLSIRRLTPAGEVSTVARISTTVRTGGFWLGHSGWVQAPVDDLAASPDGTLFVAAGIRIVKISAGGTAETIAGYASDWAPDSDAVSGEADGDGPGARFRGARGIALGPDGALFVADSANNRIRRVRIPH